MKICDRYAGGVIVLGNESKLALLQLWEWVSGTSRGGSLRFWPWGLCCKPWPHYTKVTPTGLGNAIWHENSEGRRLGKRAGRGGMEERKEWWERGQEGKGLEGAALNDGLKVKEMLRKEDRWWGLTITMGEETGKQNIDTLNEQHRYCCS